MKFYREGTLLRGSSGDLWMITEITKKVWGQPPAEMTYTYMCLRDSRITHSPCRVIHHQISVDNSGMELVSES
jgi:hypothetical protein